MKYIRTLIEYLYLLCATPVLGILCSVFSFVDRKGKTWWFISKFWSYYMLKAGGMTGLYITGEESLDNLEGAILMSNHNSHFDPPVMIAASKKKPLSFLMKHTLFYFPVFGIACYLMGHIYINRRNSARARRSIEKAGEKIREGRVVFIFPEGTRNRTETMLKFKNGGFIIALTGKVPIVPVGIAGTRNLLPPGWLCMEKSPVVVLTGKAIETSTYTMKDKAQLKLTVEKEISGLVKKAETIRQKIIKNSKLYENNLYKFWSKS